MSKLSAFIPRYTRPTPPVRLPPARLPLFRSVVAHPLPASSAPPSASTSAATPEHQGAHHIIYSTSPRLLIPLTISPQNHKLWNPPAVDAAGSRVVERDESGRLAKFAARFAPSGGSGSGGDAGEGAEAEGVFAPEADLSFLEGETLQSPDRPLGKREIMCVFPPPPSLVVALPLPLLAVPT